MKRSGKSMENKIERKTIEKDRRIKMKGLCLKLASLIPNHHFKTPKEYLSHQDQIDHAAAYIKDSRKRIEELERRKRELMDQRGATKYNAENNDESNLPILEIKDLGTDFEVVLISGMIKNFKLHQIIRIIEDGGAHVVSVNLATIHNKTFHTLHAQAKFSRVGVDTSRITERIHALIF